MPTPHQRQSPSKRRPATSAFSSARSIDFLCLGGSSLFLLPFLFVLPEADYRAPVATTMLLDRAPHQPSALRRTPTRSSIAASPERRFGRTSAARCRRATSLPGLIAPAILVAFCAFAIVRGDARLLGYGGNVMALFVGWHYVKQGYGMLMVDAVLKRKFFKDPEKKVFLVNSYLVWIFAWLSVNDAISKQHLWGLEYYTFAVPGADRLDRRRSRRWRAGSVSLWVLYTRWRENGGLPWNGVLAYSVSLYLWLLFVRVNPLWLLVVPALHSLQYLIVVWRYELNYEKSREGRDASADRSVRRAHFRQPLLRKAWRSSSRPGFCSAISASGACRNFSTSSCLTTRRLRRHDVPVRVLDLHQRPPLLLGQRDVAAGEPGHAEISVQLMRAMWSDNLPIYGASRGAVQCGGLASKPCDDRHSSDFAARQCPAASGAWRQRSRDGRRRARARSPRATCTGRKSGEQRAVQEIDRERARAHVALPRVVIGAERRRRAGVVAVARKHAPQRRHIAEAEVQPCAPIGGKRCAASPTSIVRRAAKRSASAAPSGKSAGRLSSRIAPWIELRALFDRA